MDNRKPGAAWRDKIPGLPESACPEMATIPPGSFLMGSPRDEDGRYRDRGIEAAIEEWTPSDGSVGDPSEGEEYFVASFEGPQHEVSIGYTFALGRFAVTFAQWDAARAAGADLHDPDDEGWGRADRPAINVDWNDALAYIAFLNDRLGLTGRFNAYRLPSEAEWEYACRAGTATPFYCGATIASSQANFNGARADGTGGPGVYRKKTTPIGSFPPNDFGLFDMHGNVDEWCADIWHETYQGAPANGSAWMAGGIPFQRALRGGSWIAAAKDLRSACRGGNTAERCNLFGFRLARTITRPPIWTLPAAVGSLFGRRRGESERGSRTRASDANG